MKNITDFTLQDFENMPILPNKVSYAILMRDDGRIVNILLSDLERKQNAENMQRLLDAKIKTANQRKFASGLSPLEIALKEKIA